MSDELIMCVEIDEISPILCEIITGKRIQVRVNLPAEVIRKYGALIEQRRYDGLSAEEVELFAEFLPLIWRSSDGLRWSPLEVKNLYFTLEWRGALKAWWDLLNISMQLILVQMEGEQGPYQSQKLLSPGEQEPSRKIKRVNKDTK